MGFVARDLSERDLKRASYRAREQGRRALESGKADLAAFWTSVLGEFQGERTRRFSEKMRAE